MAEPLEAIFCPDPTRAGHVFLVLGTPKLLQRIVLCPTVESASTNDRKDIIMVLGSLALTLANLVAGLGSLL